MYILLSKYFLQLIYNYSFIAFIKTSQRFTQNLLLFYKNQKNFAILSPEQIIILSPFSVLIPRCSVGPYRPLFYHECKFIWVSCWWHPLSIQLSGLVEPQEVMRLILITHIDKITITDMFSPLQRPTHASIRLDVDKQCFNEVSSEEEIMDVAGICWRPEWIAFLFGFACWCIRTSLIWL